MFPPRLVRALIAGALILSSALDAPISAAAAMPGTCAVCSTTRVPDRTHRAPLAIQRGALTMAASIVRPNDRGGRPPFGDQCRSRTCRVTHRPIDSLSRPGISFSACREVWPVLRI